MAAVPAWRALISQPATKYGITAPALLGHGQSANPRTLLTRRIRGVAAIALDDLSAVGTLDPAAVRGQSGELPHLGSASSPRRHGSQKVLRQSAALDRQPSDRRLYI